MAYPIASDITLSTNAYTKTANLITGRNQFLGKGKIQVFARGSAVGMRLSLIVNGVAICDDQVIPYFGATGSLSMKDHIVLEQNVAGGTAEFYLRNTTAGALTTDYTILFTPM
jgi:hypothetical protein